MKKGLFVTLSVLFTVMFFGCASTPAASTGEPEEASSEASVLEQSKSENSETAASSDSSALSDSGKAESVEISEENKQSGKKDSSKKSLYEDWKYKGFGKQIPEWVTPALNGDTEKVRKVFGFDQNVQLEILTGYGINVDQSENKLKSQVKGDLQFVDGFWVLLNSNQHKDEPYVTILIYRN